MPAFQIVFGTKDQPKEEWSVWEHTLPFDYDTEEYPTINEWDNPQEPNIIVKQLNTSLKLYNPYKRAYMLRRLADQVDYLAREASRDDYQPFETQGKAFHCAELKNGVISYYNTRFDAYDDRRTEIKLGRYLRQYTQLDDNAIADICARHGVECQQIELKWARTREEIADIYKRGPRSCMRGDASDFGLREDDKTNLVHPTEAYASPDLGVAYIEREGRVTARTVVNMNDKAWVCIYGDSIRLSELLRAAGFDDNMSSPMEGCRLLKIPVNCDAYACPYIDDDVYAADHDAEFLICSTEKGACYSEEGYVPTWATESSHRVNSWNEPEEEYDDSWD